MKLRNASEQAHEPLEQEHQKTHLGQLERSQRNRTTKPSYQLKYTASKSVLVGIKSTLITRRMRQVGILGREAIQEREGSEDVEDGQECHRDCYCVKYNETRWNGRHNEQRKS